MCKAERRWGTRVPCIISKTNVWSWSDILSTVEPFFFFFSTSAWQRLCFECVCRSRACVHHNEDQHPAGPDAGGAVAETVSWCGQKANWDKSDGDWKDGATRCLLRERLWRGGSAWCLFKRGLRETKCFWKMGKVIIELVSHIVIFFLFLFFQGERVKSCVGCVTLLESGKNEDSHIIQFTVTFMCQIMWNNYVFCASPPPPTLFLCVLVVCCLNFLQQTLKNDKPNGQNKHLFGKNAGYCLMLLYLCFNCTFYSCHSQQFRWNYGCVRHFIHLVAM